MHMAFELAANKAHVCFIGTPHENLTFTPKEWENMNRKEFKLTGSWMSYSAPYPGREWELTAHYFATGQLKFDRASSIENPDEPGTGGLPAVQDAGPCKRKDPSFQ